jgi:hypothetical protein
VPNRKNNRTKPSRERFDFNEALLIEPVYDPPERFLEAFYEFDARLKSLQRYVEFGAKFVKTYLVESRRSLTREKTMGSTELGLFHEEMTLSDETFRYYLKSSVLVQLFSLIENLFLEVAKDMAKRRKQALRLPMKPMPHFNKYVYYFENDCGLRLEIEKETWKTLEALREIRNRYVHELARDVPENIRMQLETITGVEEYANLPTDEAYMREAFKTVGHLAKKLDVAYWARYDEMIEKIDG